MSFDVFALSSRTEGLPLVIVEAMASGLPVVSTRVGGIDEVVQPGRTGLLLEAGDEATLAAQLAMLRAAPELAERLGQAGQQVARQRYSAERMVDEYLRLYARLRG